MSVAHRSTLSDDRGHSAHIVVAGLSVVGERESLDGAGTSQAVMVGLRAKSRPKVDPSAVTALRAESGAATGECRAD